MLQFEFEQVKQLRRLSSAIQVSLETSSNDRRGSWEETPKWELIEEAK